MSATNAAMLSLIACVGILLGHRSTESLRAWTSKTGILAVAAGYAALVIYWLTVEFSIFAAASTWSCADKLGLSGNATELRSVIDVHRRFFPPSVECTAGSLESSLTDPSTTSAWAGVWALGWLLVGVGVALLAAGLIRSRGWAFSSDERAPSSAWTEQ